MNPPVREARHRERLWQALADGTADILGSDHAPHTLDEKAKPYPASPSGMPGVQTLVPVMLDHVAAGRLTIERFVDLTSAGPARLFQIAGKGRIAVGYDADLTVVDLKRRADDRRFVDRLARRLDPVRRAHRHRLAGRHRCPRPPRHVGRRVGRAGDRPDGQIPRGPAATRVTVAAS